MNDRAPRRDLLVPIATGVACYFTGTRLRNVWPDSPPLGVSRDWAWVVLSTLAAAACGFAKPRVSWLNGALLMAAQSATLFTVLALHGEIVRPTCASGGIITWFVWTVLGLIVTPLPVVASFIGARIGRLRR